MARTGQQLRGRTAQAMVEGRNAPRARPVPANNPGLGNRLRYLFDNSMSAGTPALVGWLSAVTLVLIVAFAGFTALMDLRADDDPNQGFAKETFQALLHALDPGTIGGDSGSWRFLLTMLALTIAGLFIASALIGVIAAGIDNKLADLRRGRSIVLENDHTVILGWSDSIFTIVSELATANESRKKPVVVVLADRDKVDMEDELKAKVADLKGTKVICRSGSPIDLDDLALSSHQTARSVILLASDSEDPDSEVIKTLLALRHAGPGGPRIVAEIRNPSNLEAARLVGAERTVLLDIRETVAKLVVQTSRQSGAAAVYTELFDYDGDEIYFLEEHSLGGRTYAEAQLAFDEASIIGVILDGVAKLNPAPHTVLGDHTLIVIAEDDEGLGQHTATSVEPDLRYVAVVPGIDEHPTKALIIGWNERADIVVRELDYYAPDGSSLTVLTALGRPVIADSPHLSVDIEFGSTTDRATLERHITPDLDQIIVLCYSADLPAQAADAKTLVTLLHVRDILSRSGATTTVVSEMLDDRNRKLAAAAAIDDVVVSGEIVSLLVTQLSEDPRLEPVFGELLGNDGSEIYLRPVSWYVQPGEELTYATVVAGAIARGETAIGYKAASLAEDGQTFGVVVNPPKSTIFRIHADDRVVVLAED